MTRKSRPCSPLTPPARRALLRSIAAALIILLFCPLHAPAATLEIKPTPANTSINQRENSRTLTLHIHITRAVPDFIVLSGPSSRDTLWPSANDALYHVTITDSGPALYLIEIHAAAQTVPLLLTSQKDNDDLTISLQADTPLSSLRCPEAQEAEIYAAAKAIMRTNEALYRVTQTLSAQNGNPLSAMLQNQLDSFTVTLQNDLRIQLGQLHKRLDTTSFANQSHITQATLNGFLHIFSTALLPQQEKTQKLFWNSNILNSPIIPTTPEFAYHIEDYILSGRSDSLTRQEQENAYRSALQHLIAHTMSPQAHLRIEQHLKHILIGTPYESLYAQLVDPTAQTSLPTPCPDPKKIKKLTYNDIHGVNTPLIHTAAPHTLLIVWSIWCEHCQQELPRTLELLKPHLEKLQIAIRTIPLEPKAPFPSAHIQSLKWPGSHLILKEKELNKLLDLLAVNGTPAYFLFHQNGTLIDTPISPEQISALLNALTHDTK